VCLAARLKSWTTREPLGIAVSPGLVCEDYPVVHRIKGVEKLYAASRRHRY
jgi:hypothetical protein